MSGESNGDVRIVRDLVRRYLEVCHRPVQAERRDLWRRHNSLEPTRPLIYLRGGRAFREVPEIRDLRCTDPFWRGYERWLQTQLFVDRCGDDSTFEPWLTVGAVHVCEGWGVEPQRESPDDPRGSYKEQAPLARPEDIEKLRFPWHEIDEAATAERVRRVGDALGDLIEINVSRAPAYRVAGADLSTWLGHLRGIENVMFDMMDRPEWLHRLMAFLRDGVLAAQDQAERAGDWGLADGENQAMPYAQELPDPAANVRGVARKQLWVRLAAQELTLVSPAQHDEFMLQYQLPILAKFGLSSYGCCEDLTRKIDMVRQIPNLRRIAVAPAADLARCAEQIAADYVISWRPSPAEMVGWGFDADRVRAATRDAIETCRGQHMDVTLKDVDTVQDDPQRMIDWVRVTRETIEEFA